MLASLLMPAALAAPPDFRRIWAIGDLHGDAFCAKHWVGVSGLVGNLSSPDPAFWSWQEEHSALLFMGDYIDKGPEARATLEFVHALSKRFPRSVIPMMGNHELNLLVDRASSAADSRYHHFAYGAAHPAQYASWLEESEVSDETPRALEAIHKALLAVYDKSLHAQVKMAPEGRASILNLVAPADRDLVKAELSRWQAAYLRGVRPSSVLGGWLQRRPLSVIVGGTLFVHGGLDPSLLEHIIDRAAEGQRPQEALAQLNAMLSAAANGAGLAAAEARGEAAAAAAAGDEAAAEAEGAAAEDEAAAEALAHLVWSDPRIQSLVEYRGLHEAQQGCRRVSKVLALLNVSRVAVGHTPGSSVRVLCGGGLLALDSSLGRNFRASGNMYCWGPQQVGGATQAREDICPLRAESCEGQIVRLDRPSSDHADDASPAGEGGGWSVRIVSATGEEVSFDDGQAKVEL